jgi:hypothetical protein
LIVEVTSKLDALAWARVGDVDAVQLPVCRGAEIPEKMPVKYFVGCLDSVLTRFLRRAFEDPDAIW